MDEFKGSCAQLNQIGIDILDLGENSESELNNSHNNKMISEEILEISSCQHVNMSTFSFTLEIIPGTLNWLTKSVSFALSCYSDYHSNDKDVIISLSLLYHKVNIGKYYFLNNWRNI